MVRCPQAGELRLIIDDYRGGVVVPAGDGRIAELQLSLRADAAEGDFALNPVVNQARNGPARVELAALPGRLVITTCT
jgi:hypothetical protein